VKGSRKKSKRSSIASRQLLLHGCFRPDNPDIVDMAAFMEFWAVAQERLAELGRKKLLRKKSEFAKFRKLRRKVKPIFSQTFRDELTPAEAAAKIKRLVPDEKLRREIFDFWSDAARKTPEQLEKEKQEIAVEEEALAKSEKVLKAREAVSEAVAQLNELASAGDAEAAKALVESANLAGLHSRFWRRPSPK
jgi:hypothetical protein